MKSDDAKLALLAELPAHIPSEALASLVSGSGKGAFSDLLSRLKDVLLMSNSPAVMDAASGSLKWFLNTDHAKKAEVCVCVGVCVYSGRTERRKERVAVVVVGRGRGVVVIVVVGDLVIVFVLYLYHVFAPFVSSDLCFKMRGNAKRYTFVSCFAWCFGTVCELSFRNE